MAGFEKLHLFIYTSWPAIIKCQLVGDTDCDLVGIDIAQWFPSGRDRCVPPYCGTWNHSIRFSRFAPTVRVPALSLALMPTGVDPDPCLQSCRRCDALCCSLQLALALLTTWFDTVTLEAQPHWMWFTMWMFSTTWLGPGIFLDHPSPPSAFNSYMAVVYPWIQIRRNASSEIEAAVAPFPYTYFRAFVLYYPIPYTYATTIYKIDCASYMELAHRILVPTRWQYT